MNAEMPKGPRFDPNKDKVGDSVPKANEKYMKEFKEFRKSVEAGFDNFPVDKAMNVLDDAVKGKYQVNVERNAEGKYVDMKWMDAEKPTGLIGYLKTYGDVAALQIVLKKLGFDSGKIDGVWGKKTMDALMAFQKKNGLKADGAFGPNTFAALKKAVKPGGAPAPKPENKVESAPVNVSGTTDDMPEEPIRRPEGDIKLPATGPALTQTVEITTVASVKSLIEESWQAFKAGKDLDSDLTDMTKDYTIAKEFLNSVGKFVAAEVKLIPNFSNVKVTFELPGNRSNGGLVAPKYVNFDFVKKDDGKLWVHITWNKTVSDAEAKGRFEAGVEEENTNSWDRPSWIQIEK